MRKNVPAVGGWCTVSFILLPVGNNNDNVWRIPYVTFAIIAVNILVFLFTNPVMIQDQAKVNQSAEDLIQYLKATPQIIDNDRVDELYTAGVISDRDLEYLKGVLLRSKHTKADLDQYSAEYAVYQRRLSDFVHYRDNRFEMKWGYVPGKPSLVSLFTAMFLHGDFWHIFGNLLFFFAVGFSLEDLWGRSFFTAFYLFSGVMAAALHHVWNSSSMIPCIGASGAIAGVMGAYLIRLFKSKIRFFYLGLGIWSIIFRNREHWWQRFVGTFLVPAWVYLPFWFLLQCLLAFSGIGAYTGVANWAHVGGFAFGMVFAFGLKLTKLEERLLKPSIDAKIDFGSNKSVVDALDLLEQGDTQKAEMILNQVLTKFPGDFDAMLGQARLYEKLGDKDKLRQAYCRLIRHHNKALEFESSVMTYESLLCSYEEEDPQLTLDMRDWMLICDYLDKAEMHKEAAFEYRRAARAHKTNAFAAKALMLSGEIFLEKVKNNKDAAMSFVEARNLNPTQPQWAERINSGIEKIKQIEIAKGGVPRRQSDDLDPSTYASRQPVPVQTGDDRQMPGH
jgi:membrane associated rhomboid family serine protease